jgi:hypothetical protein
MRKKLLVYLDDKDIKKQLKKFKEIITIKTKFDESSKFDIIYLCSSNINKIIKLLNPNGILLVSMPIKKLNKLILIDIIDNTYIYQKKIKGGHYNQCSFFRFKENPIQILSRNERINKYNRIAHELNQEFPNGYYYCPHQPQIIGSRINLCTQLKTSGHFAYIYESNYGNHSEYDIFIKKPINFGNNQYVKMYQNNIKNEKSILETTTNAVINRKHINFILLYKTLICKEDYLFLMEKAQGDLGTLFQIHYNNHIIISRLLRQCIMTILSLRKLGFYHNDAHYKNFLYFKIQDNANLYYIYKGRNIFSNSNGYLLTLTDYGSSSYERNLHIINLNIHEKFRNKNQLAKINITNLWDYYRIIHDFAMIGNQYALYYIDYIENTLHITEEIFLNFIFSNVPFINIDKSTGYIYNNIPVIL